jgi:hypothetical protein
MQHNAPQLFVFMGINLVLYFQPSPSTDCSSVFVLVRFIIGVMLLRLAAATPFR